MPKCYRPILTLDRSKVRQVHDVACERYYKIRMKYPGVQLEGDLGEILVLGAEISPCIGLREKWEFP